MQYLYTHVNAVPFPGSAAWRHAPLALGAHEQEQEQEQHYSMAASLAKDIDEIGHCNSVYAKGQRTAEVV